jgi:hypothetical protein
VTAEPYAAIRWRGVLAWLLVFAAALMLLLAAAGYYAPQAMLTIGPQTQPVQIIADLTADPALAGPDGLVVPVRALEWHQPWETRGHTTGRAAADRERLRALARQELGATAPQLLAARLAPGQALVPNSARVTITGETFRLSAGEAILRLDTVLTGSAVETADLEQVAAAQLRAAAPAGFVPGLDSVHVEPGDGGAADRLQITARATGRATIDPATVAARLAGQPIPDAHRYLETELPADEFSLAVGPGWWRAWFGRLPLHAGRVRVVLLP